MTPHQTLIRVYLVFCEKQGLVSCYVGDDQVDPCPLWFANGQQGMGYHNLIFFYEGISR